MGAFFIVIVALICKRSCSCKNKKKSKNSSSEADTDDDSYDEDDDIIIASAKPKNPFKLMQEPDADQKYRLYGPEKKLPSHALVRTED
jgi:hypothetical protein